MSKFIQLINLNEIKALRVTCKCGAYWSVPMQLGNNELPNKCNYCKGQGTVIPPERLGYIKGLLKNIDDIHKHLENYNISIELETEKEKTLK